AVRPARAHLRALLHHAPAGDRPRARGRAADRGGPRRPHRGGRAPRRRCAFHHSAARGRPGGGRRMTPRILVVDDEERMAAVVSGALTHAGWECETFVSGAAGLGALERREADVLVSDWQIPGMVSLGLLIVIHERR